MNCLVKTYNVVVNNPDLPILETMQQFTLNAITASGNSSMTDAQKWALNHFFYQMGAIDNNTLWQKIKHLIIPMICNDNLSTVYTNYVDNTVSGSVYSGSDPAFVNHGINVNEGNTAKIFGTNIFSGDSYNISTVIVTMNQSMAVNTAGSGNYIIDKNTSDRISLMVGKSQSSNQYFSTKPVSLYVPYTGEPIYDVACLNNREDYADLKLISSLSDVSILRIASQSDLDRRAAKITYMNNAIRYNAGTTATGLALVAEALTDTERDTIMLAAKSLKLAFSESNI